MDVVEWLLDIDADANAKDNDHRTPLHLAAAGGHLEVVRTLMGHGVDVNAAMTWGDHTPLHEASSGGHVDMVRLLIENGADESSRLDKLLLLASSSRSAETVQHGMRDRTPLHLASQALSSSSGDVVQTLIMNGADVNARDEGQRVRLCLWRRHRHRDVVRTLILNGADVSARDEGRRTPLHLASWLSNDVVQTLIPNRTGVNTQDGSHLTPLHLASLSLKGDVGRTLIPNGANVNARDEGRRR
ncbi:ankyrin repeat-containing domain protein [Lactarius hengduanensis]|nr:ankyrin repeat-containing domain protein [Lactarius hengduanensis]